VCLNNANKWNKGIVESLPFTSMIRCLQSLTEVTNSPAMCSSRLSFSLMLSSSVFSFLFSRVGCAV
jgi:hypothetical protein